MVTKRDYSDAYYGDFFGYTREKLGSDRLIMSRDRALGIYRDRPSGDSADRRFICFHWTYDNMSDDKGKKEVYRMPIKVLLSWGHCSHAVKSPGFICSLS